MSESSDIRTGRHCTFNLIVHLVFITKYRRNVITKDVQATLEASFNKICLDFEAQLQECNAEDDHVHLLVSYQPKTSISSLVNSLKGASSRIVRKQHPEIRNKLWGNAFWSASYYAGSTGGANINTVKAYIEAQR